MASWQSSRRSSAPAATADAVPLSSPVPDRTDDDGGAAQQERERLELRRGPWTVDEDLALVNYITGHGEGRWNSLAQAAGTCTRSPPDRSIDLALICVYLYKEDTLMM